MAECCARCGIEGPSRKLYPPEEWVEHIRERRLIDDLDGPVAVPLCRECHDQLAPLRESYRRLDRLPADRRETVRERTQAAVADLDPAEIDDESGGQNWTRFVRDRVDAIDLEDVEHVEIDNIEEPRGNAVDPEPPDATTPGTELRTGWDRRWQYAPPALVGIAWTTVAGAETGLFGSRTLLFVHLLVLAGAGIAVRALDGPGLLAWRAVVLLGLAGTALGTLALLSSPIQPPLLAASLVAWAVAPTLGLLYSGLGTDGSAYLVAGACSAVGVVGFAAGSVLANPIALGGLALLAAGHVVGVVTAMDRGDVPTGSGPASSVD